ncbi:MAG: metallophosphoesterase [Clostridia bacterium]|nr:metallophosphoesterase [Clostridia bacterium]
MVRLLSEISLAAAILTGVNVFLHAAFLSCFRKRKWLGALVGFILGGLAAYFSRDVFSTSGMALLNFSLALLGMDFIGLVLRLFGKGNPYAFFRKWKKRGLALFIAAIYAAYGLINIHVVRKTEYSFENPNVKSELTVGLVSDSHLGTAMDDEKLIRVLRKMVDGGADVLVLAGDIVDESTDKDMFLRFAEGMKNIRAPKGVYFVFGNHDGPRYGGNITHLEIETAFALSGVTVLTDESVLIDDWLRIVGRKDASKKRAEIEALLSGADTENEFVIMIDHQPAETFACSQSGVDLLLSGHTHNGQIFPINIISELFRINEIEYGHKAVGDMNAVVSSGVAGWGSAFRTAGKSEYVMIYVTKNQ